MTFPVSNNSCIKQLTYQKSSESKSKDLSFDKPVWVERHEFSFLCKELEKTFKIN